MHVALRAAGFSLMTMFVSCGVGAQALDARIGTIAMEGEPKAAADEYYLDRSLALAGLRVLNPDQAKGAAVNGQDQALHQLNESQTTLHSQAEHQQESLATALRSLHPVPEKDVP